MKKKFKKQIEAIKDCEDTILRIRVYNDGDTCCAVFEDNYENIEISPIGFDENYLDAITALIEDFRRDSLIDDMKNLINNVLDGEINIYDIHNNPEGELQERLSKVISKLYEEVGQEGLHLDDDSHEIYESIAHSLETKLTVNNIIKQMMHEQNKI